MTYRRIISSLLILLAAACTKEADYSPAVSDGRRSYTVSATAAAPQTKGQTFIENDAFNLSGFQFSIFSAEGCTLLYHSSNNSTVRLNREGRYNVYAWAGVPSINAATATDEAALSTAVCPFTDNPSDWVTASGWKQMPLSGAWRNVSGRELDLLDGSEDGLIRLPMGYLFAKVNISVTYDDLIGEMCGSNYGVSSISLGGARRDVSLFSEGDTFYPSSHSVVQYQGDVSYVVYVPESLAGDLLPDNVSPDRKTPATLEAAGLDPTAYPFIEVVIDYQTSFFNSSVKYRFYLGENPTTNFDVRRNSVYNITLHVDYDSVGCTFSGAWKIDAEPVFDDDFQLDVFPKIAYPSQTVALYHHYSNAAGTADYNDYYRQSGGYAIGLLSDADDYLSSGVLPDGFATRAPEGRILVCNDCKAHYFGLAGTSSQRIAWLNSHLKPSGGGNYYCDNCDAFIIDITVGGSDRNAILSSNSAYAGSTFDILTNYGDFVLYDIPTGAPVGTPWIFQMWTRDGRLIESQSVDITRNKVTPAASRAKRSDLYIAQRDTVTITSWKEAAYGPDPDFDFTSSDDDVFSVTKIGKRQAVVSADKSVVASASVKIYFDSENIMDIPVSVVAPTMKTDRQYVNIRNNGNSTYLSAPYYLKKDGSRYGDYEADLFASVLGEPELVEIPTSDLTSYISASNGISYGKPIHFVRLERVMAGGTGMPFNGFGEIIHWRSPYAYNVIPQIGERAYFEDNKYAGISWGMVPGKVNSLYYNYDATNGTKTWSGGSAEYFVQPSEFTSSNLISDANVKIKDKSLSTYFQRATVGGRNVYKLLPAEKQIITGQPNGQGKSYTLSLTVKGNDNDDRTINFLNVNVYANYYFSYDISFHEDDCVIWGTWNQRASEADYHYPLDNRLCHVDITIRNDGTFAPSPSTLFNVSTSTPIQLHTMNEWDSAGASYYRRYNEASGYYFWDFWQTVEENTRWKIARDYRHQRISGGYQTIIDRMWWRPAPAWGMVFSIVLDPVVATTVVTINASTAGTWVHRGYTLNDYLNENQSLFKAAPNAGWLPVTESMFNYDTSRYEAMESENNLRRYFLPKSLR